MLTATILGTPQQQGSKRVFGGRAVEANKKLAPWRADAIATLAKAMAEQQVGQFAGPVTVEAAFNYARPAAHYGTGRNADRLKPSAPHHKPSAPDLDKLQRALGDALTQAGVLRDDALIVEWKVVKRWAAAPSVQVTVSTAPIP